MKNLLIIGGSKFVGKSFINYFNLNNKYKNLKIIIISKKKIYIKKRKKIKIIKKDFKNVKKLPVCNYILYCLRTDKESKDAKLFKLFEKKLLQLKKKPKIIYASSGVLYGENNSKRKISETSAISLKKIQYFQNYKKKWFKQKLKMEKLFFELSQKNFKILILRMFSFIGPSILDQKYVPSELIKKFSNNQKIILNGPLNTYRSYLYESDFVEWIIKIFYKLEKQYDIYNFGSDKAITIYELANKIGKYYNFKNVFLLNKSNKLDYYVPSINKLKKNFKVKINVPLNISIMKSIKK
tara:strand:- start:359 stop:1246 length:888 start_codon:yes stop_codon:yes gene_type:complete